MLHTTKVKVTVEGLRFVTYKLCISHRLVGWFVVDLRHYIMADRLLDLVGS